MFNTSSEMIGEQLCFKESRLGSSAGWWLLMRLKKGMGVGRVATPVKHPILTHAVTSGNGVRFTIDSLSTF